MALRYHWGLGIGHTFSHYVACGNVGLEPTVQSCKCVNMHLRSNGNGLSSIMEAESNSTSMDKVVDDEAAELMLVDCKALDQEEDSDSEVSETEKVSEDERDSTDVYDELGSDPEWIDTED